MNYDNFDLAISREGNGYISRVTASPVGEASEHVDELPPRAEVDAFFSMLRGISTFGKLDPDQAIAVQRLGETLFRSALRGAVAERLAASMAHLDGRGDAALRIRLRLDDCPELIDLPWELLYSQAHTWLALRSSIALTRYLSLPQSLPSLTISGPLKILAVISTPDGTAKLDLEKEHASLERAIDALRGLRGAETIEFTTLSHPTGDSLRNAVRRTKPHVFHFMGHGTFSAEAGGSIVLEDERRQPVLVGAERFAMLLEGGGIRLAVMNACEGSRTDGSSPFNGVAQALLRASVPAVVAMQFPFSDDASQIFARVFYESLSEGLDVETAMCESRKQLFFRSNVEWAAPTLYLRASTGALFTYKRRRNTAKPVVDAVKPLGDAPAATPNPLASSMRLDELVPYLVDRVEQEKNLTDALRFHAEHLPHRPIVLLVEAAEEQAVYEFLHRVKHAALKPALRSVKYNDRIEWSDMLWPGDGWQKAPSKTLESLKGDMAQYLDLSGSWPTNLLNKATSLGKTLVLSYYSVAERWNDAHYHTLRGWIDSWAELPDLVTGCPIIAVIAIAHREQPNAFLGRLKIRRPADLTRKHLLARLGVVQDDPDRLTFRLRGAQGRELAFVVTSPFGNVTFAHIQQWVDRQVVPPDPPRMIQEIKIALRHFDERSLYRTGIPMNQLIGPLRTVWQSTAAALPPPGPRTVA